MSVSTCVYNYLCQKSCMRSCFSMHVQVWLLVHWCSIPHLRSLAVAEELLLLSTERNQLRWLNHLPSIHFLFLIFFKFLGHRGLLEPISAVKGREAGYTLDISPANRRGLKNLPTGKCPDWRTPPGRSGYAWQLSPLSGAESSSCRRTQEDTENCLNFLMTHTQISRNITKMTSP